MTGSEIVQIISLVLTAIVSIVTLLVRARIIALEGEIKDLNTTLTAANTLIMKQGNTIDAMSEQIVAMAGAPTRSAPKDEPYTAMPPYRKQK